jgi:S1-C subfamily serine protease
MLPTSHRRQAGFFNCLAATAVVGLALSGCATTPPNGAWQAPPGAVAVPTSATPRNYDFSGIQAVRFNGRPLPPLAALQAENQNFALTLSQIAPQDRPIAGRARIVLPDHDRLRLLTTPRSNEGVINFQAEQRRLGLHVMADAVIRSNLFAAVDLFEQNDTAAPASDGVDYLIWYQVQSAGFNNSGPWIGRWQIKRAGNATADYIGVDPGTAAGAPRLLSFVKSVSLAATHPGAGGHVPSPAGGGHAMSVGTGIVVDMKGHVLTNNHVVAICANPQVTDAEGGAGSATVLARDESNDLALLRTDRHWPASARFRDSRGLRPGEPLVVTGFPLTGLVSPEMAVTTGSLTALAGIHGDRRQIQFSAPIQPGNSGGPVLDESGRVVAIASSMLNGLVLAAATGALPQNVNFAIKTDIAAQFLAANQVVVGSAPSRPLGDAASVADLARKFTVKIACEK